MTLPHNTPHKTRIHWADIGVNLTDKQFRDDRDNVLKRARAGGETLGDANYCADRFAVLRDY